jgi:hypothetical protein
MTFTGEFNRFHGQSLPVYAPKEPTNGRPSINTLEGWNTLRHELAERDLLRKLHRQPTEAEIIEELARNEVLRLRLWLRKGCPAPLHLSFCELYTISTVSWWKLREGLGARCACPMTRTPAAELSALCWGGI